jgi:transcriptional regulator GlxA family with amidase domain
MKQIILTITLVSILFACSTQASDQVRKQPEKVETGKEDSLQLAKEIANFRPENSSHTMEAIFGKPRHTIKTIGILVYDGVNDLDVMGPRYVLGQAMDAKTQLIALKPGHIKTVMGVEIVPGTSIDSVSQLDILIIPCGLTGTLEAAFNKSLHQWIQRIDRRSTYTGAVCTGVWVLGATGLLKDKKASANWYREEEFLRKYKAIPANQRYTRDGKYWTSAGVTAGMDMSLAMLKEIYGDQYAQAVMLDMEYDPAPPVEGGIPEKTDWAVNWLMKTLYDERINPLMDSLEQKNKTHVSSKSK